MHRRARPLRGGRSVRPLRPMGLAAMAFVTLPTAASAGEVDFSGLEPFWAVAEMIASDHDPPASARAALFSTPGYASLQARENADEFLRRLPPLALSPAPASAPKQEAYAIPSQTIFVGHLRTAFAHRDELTAFRAEPGDAG